MIMWVLTSGYIGWKYELDKMRLVNWIQFYAEYIVVNIGAIRKITKFLRYVAFLLVEHFGSSEHLLRTTAFSISFISTSYNLGPTN